ncbi:MAG: protein kinase domain-containing protein [Gemmatimonadaceae bacterium]
MADVRDILQTSLGASYTIERELGGGGMSRVFVAEENSLGRKVVVKVLQPEMAAGVSVERFKREIVLAARLQHPHIVPLLIAGEAGGLPYYTMPLVEGESLRQRLIRGSVPTDEAMSILRDMALALEYAHGHAVVHRDIKPENILLTGRSAVVTDFGIARAISAAAGNESRGTLTTNGTVVGTPAYMAPEQAAGGEVDARTDLYAWGVIAYELFAGHPFASRGSAQALLAAHITETPAPLTARRKDIPAPIAALVHRCLAKDPNERPASAAQLLADPALAAHLAPRRNAWRAPSRLVPVLLAIALILTAGGWTWRRAERRHWASVEAIDSIRRLKAADHSLAAFLMLREAQRYAPADSQLANYSDAQTGHIAVTSSPAGATVAIQDYLSPDSAWYTLGVTPLKSVPMPRGYFRWKLSKEGLADYTSAPQTLLKMNFALDSALVAPSGMVRVGAATWGNMIAFVGWVGPYKLPTFFMDKYEVTNKEYQEFVDKGGYADAKYWEGRFIEHGREIPRDEAMARFRDHSGRPGPSTWQGGHFPDGQANYPVSGVSWYEARAYAAFAGKSLPTFAQWFRAAPSGLGTYIVRESNIARAGPAPVGSFKGMGPFGTYDMAGNVREWTENSLDPDRRFILGGASNAQTYLYADPEALSPFDRSPENGVRCVKNITPLTDDVLRPVKPLERDFAAYHPASDEVYRAYQNEFAYAKSPLHEKVEGVVHETPDWREEKITFDAAYNNERMAAYLFIPKNVKPPYQAVVFFPSARVDDLRSSDALGDIGFFDYVVQSGRAVLYPIYQQTYERRSRNIQPGASQAIDLTIQRSRDLGRSLDYLQTRSDIAADKLAYLGVSMGAAEGVIYATIAQDRLKTVILLDGGYFLGRAPAGGDQADFAPRMKKPVLMVNGRYDFTFSLERSQEPLFRMLGTPAADKQHVVLETPHDVTAQKAALTTAVLGWLDKYLGRVQ